MARDPWRVDRQIGRQVSWLPHVTGRYYAPQTFATSQTTGTPALLTIYAQPIFIPATKTYDRISMEVTTQDAIEPNDIMVGIYTNGSSAPDALVVGAELDCAGTAPFAIEATISQSLTGNTWYWLVYSQEGAAVFRSWLVTAALPFIGIPTANIAGTSTNYFAWAATWDPWAATLPATFPGSGAPVNVVAAAAKILLRAG